eukprot:gnl/TRDRNA2_/TRDRNA2_179652_c0_seq1.p1 gnl/TRDRNA2_/TRDRNA2_179652_c0~~gnl/TRDRNA2_/TRDRNA2_179652_c0_seq1.p1  ORF type:complete len:180 (+),score=22.02 gnl/TRDRNA2_/TRDRNA2_179652_c0_seq1:113-652(+)
MPVTDDFGSAHGSGPQPDCSKPPYCHKWWLSADANFWFLCVVVVGVIGTLIVSVVTLILCAGITLLGRSCAACCGEQPKQRSPELYQAVKQHDDTEEELGGQSTANSGTRGGWKTALRWFCLGALASALVLGSSGTLWWYLSGSPHLIGLPLTSSVNGSHTGDSRRRRRKGKSGGDEDE